MPDDIGSDAVASQMEEHELKRKLATIMVADIVGFSRLTAQDEDWTIRTLGEFRQVVDDIIAQHDGRIFNTGGDSVLAEFASPVEAVRCAVDFQEAARSRNLLQPRTRQLRFRIGINLGDVMARGSDLLGDGVNVAARLEGLAEPGGICVSGTVWDQIHGKLSLGYVDMGEQTVKNIPRPVRAYQLRIDGSVEEVAPAAHAQFVAAVGKRRSLKLTHGLVLAIVIILVGGVAWHLWHADSRKELGMVASRQTPPSSDAPAVQREVVPPPTAHSPQPPENARVASPSVSVVAPPAVLPSSGPQPAAIPHSLPALPSLDEIQKFAAARGMPLPRDLRIDRPAADVPAEFARFSGVWGGDNRWNGVGRQLLIVVESIERSGRSIIVWAASPPNSNTYNQAQANWHRVPAQIAGNKISYEPGKGFKNTFTLFEDGRMFGISEPNLTANPPFRGAQIWLSTVSSGRH